MNTKKFNKTLQKLNDLYSSISRNSGEINAIEVDLLRSYVIKLYELSLDQTEKNPKKEFKKVKSFKPKEIEEKVEIKEPAPEPFTPAPPPPPVNIEVEQFQAETIETEEKESEPADPELEALFGEVEVRELSDKLGLIPVSDLSRSMGINEKVFTIHELFGGDQSEFDAVIKDLNRLESFEDAKEALIAGPASKHSWGSEEKRKKAGNFIRLVRRKYV